LRAEHDEIIVLFNHYARTRSEARRSVLLRTLCNLMRLHLTVETGVLIPALSMRTGDQTLLEHVGAKYASIMSLINELTSDNSCNDVRRLRVKQLRLRFAKHIKLTEATDGLLDRAEACDLDWTELDRAISLCRRELNARWST